MIDIQDTFGDSYKVELDETYRLEPEPRAAERPWHYQLLCQGGHIYLHGGDKLGYVSDGKGSIAKRLAKLDCVTITQDGSDGVNAVFHVDAFDRVAAVVKPRRKRRLSADHRKRLAEAGRKTRFQTEKHGSESKTGVV